MEKVKELKALWLDHLLMIERSQKEIEGIKQEIVKLQKAEQEKKEESKKLEG